jgi:SAM-dependent MidA family methyltransferase
MQPSNATLPSPALWSAFRRRAAGRPVLDFAEFMDVALYDPVAGYYRKDELRVGRGPGTDFFTATSSPLFGRLVAAACVQLLGGEDPGRFEFVELGAERGAGILDDHPHPFKSVRLIGVGEAHRIEGPSIVFSNELFDAQPFRRFRFREGAWRELGVAVAKDALEEAEVPGSVLPTALLPTDATEGYLIDAPLAAATLAQAMVRQPWEGLFVAFDYGKSWEELAYATPGGTGRAYRHHDQGNDLLAFPGDQDLTCHVCWDWLADALREGGFAAPQVESQEAFWVHHAGAFIQAFTAAEATRTSPDKQSLVQLLHPAHMGQKFQVLWGRRGLGD